MFAVTALTVLGLITLSSASRPACTNEWGDAKCNVFVAKEACNDDMIPKCELACGLCSVTRSCEDLEPDCEMFAGQEIRCDPFLKAMCPKTCGLC